MIFFKGKDEILSCNELYYPGNKVGVLLVHSLSGTPQKLEFLATALSRANFTVLAPCLSGHGTNPSDLNNVNHNQWLDDVDRSIIRLRAICEKVYLVGDSLGGSICLIASLSRPVDGVITLATPIYYRHHRLIHTLLKISSRFIPYYEKNYHSYKSYQKVPIKVMNSTYEFIKKDVTDSVPKINTPTLVIQGQKDRIVHPKSAQYIYDKIQGINKQLIWVKDGNHSLTTGNEREKIFSEIIDFINRQLKKTNGDHK